MPDTRDIKHPVLLFDGVCNLCNASVQFILRRDKRGLIRFAALQSEGGQELLKNKSGSQAKETTQLINPNVPQSVIFIEKGVVYTESDAALRVIRYLKMPWPILYGLTAVPRPLRNWVYRVVARNRYRWFGHTDACMMPTKEIRDRFLD